MAGYIKPWISFDDQLAQLAQRGMKISDQARALECLGRIGYYRLSGYWYAFRERNEVVWLDGGIKPDELKVTRLLADDFRPGTTFQNAVDLYVFDKQLRLLTLDALERIEIRLRVDIAHSLGAKDPFAYNQRHLLHADFSGKVMVKTGISRHQDWIERHDKLIIRSKEESILHCVGKYGLPLPLWVVSEVWDFGTMSTLFSGMLEADQDAIAVRYGIANGRVFASWLRSLNYLRNLCAHHSRLWNRNIVDQPRLPSVKAVPWVKPFVGNSHGLARCYLLLCIARHLLRVINPGSTWPARMKEHLQHFPQLSHLGLNVGGMGAFPGWEAAW